MTPEKTPGQDAVRAHLRTAIDAATRSASEGGGPFGAVLVTADGQEFVAVNRVTAENDPTAHAEISVCLLYTSPSPRDRQKSRMPSSA